MNLPCRISPCKNCPFRKDCLKGWLGETRITEILESESFVCHKNNSLQCAGHMIIKNNENLFYRMAQALKLKLNLKGRNLIFENDKKCVAHHSNKT